MRHRHGSFHGKDDRHVGAASQPPAEASRGNYGFVIEPSPLSMQSTDMRRTQGLFVAWGLNIGQFTPKSLVQAACDGGFTWIALQVEENSAHVHALRSACIEGGLAFGLWEAEPSPGSGAEHVRDAGATFYIAQAEAPQDWAAITSDFRSHYPTMPAAVVTNFGGIEDPVSCQPLVAAQFSCLTECYVADNPMATPENQDVMARQRGWRNSQPVLGLYHGVTYDDYNLKCLKGWSVWLAEFLLD